MYGVVGEKTDKFDAYSGKYSSWLRVGMLTVDEEHFIFYLQVFISILSSFFTS